MESYTTCVQEETALNSACDSTIKKAESKDKFSILCALVGYWFPIIGLLLGYLWIDKYPLRAKSTMMGTLLYGIALLVSNMISLVVCMLVLALYVFFMFFGLLTLII